MSHGNKQKAGWSSYPDPPAWELWLGNHKASKEVHEAVEGSREDGGHHEIGGDGHTGYPIVCEVQQSEEHEQQEPEELGCSTHARMSVRLSV